MKSMDKIDAGLLIIGMAVAFGLGAILIIGADVPMAIRWWLAIIDATVLSFLVALRVMIKRVLNLEELK